MKLYWAPKSRSFRAVWMMEEAGRPYERVLIDITSGAQSGDAYREINPMMKVPALADGAVKVAESGALCTYVAESVPEAGLAPAIGDPSRGDYLRWMFFSGSCVEGAFIEKFANVSIPSSSAGWGSFDRVVDVLEQGVSSGEWLLGERFSAADVMIGSDLYFGIDVFKIIEPRPALTAYVARCTARPAFQRAQEIEAAGV